MDLNGKFLIAMPALSDPRFERAVVLMCSHSPRGAMGIILNKPMRDLKFSELLEQLNLPAGPDVRDVPVHFGGPVEPGRGFVLHDAGWNSSKGTTPLGEGLAMTATQEVLEELAHGRGPDLALMALGYAGWGPGQLEAEIARNDWLTSDAVAELVFNGNHDVKWTAALARLRVDPLSLSASAGHA